MTTRRPLIAALVAGMMLGCWGCGLAPHSFRKIHHPAPLVRARSVGLGDREPDSQVVPALIGRLDDEDPVVRMAAHEELRRRTGQDFGYVAWATPEERAQAVGRWRSWLTGPPMPAGSLQSPQMAMAPVAMSPQAARMQARRRRRRRAQPPPAMAAIPPPQVATQGPPVMGGAIPTPRPVVVPSGPQTQTQMQPQTPAPAPAQAPALAAPVMEGSSP